MPTGDRRLILRFESPLALQWKVPLDLLATKLQAAQRMLFNIASAQRGGGRRGTWKAEVLHACELVLVETRPGSLEVVAEVPEASPSLFPDLDLDIGRQALNSMGETLSSIATCDRDNVERAFRDYAQRARILSSAMALLPEEDAEYELGVETPAGRITIREDHRPHLLQWTREQADEFVDEEIRILTGKLYLIEVATGQRRVGLIVNNRHTPCFYPAEYEDVIRDLIPGTLVEVQGRATLDEFGEVERIEEIFDARTVQDTPLHWRNVRYGDRTFRLTTTIQIQTHFRDGLWIHEYEPLGILAYAHSRGQSLEAFRMDFAAAWDVVAQEEDTNLTVDAQELKRKLLALVDKVEH